METLYGKPKPIGTLLMKDVVMNVYQTPGIRDINGAVV
jgi:hypothetical protein